MNTENKMKKIVIIAGVVIIFSFGGALSLQDASVRSGVGDMGIHGVFRRWRSIE